MVVLPAHADRLHLLRHGLRHCRRHAALHALCLRGRKIDIRCLDTIAQYLFYVFVIDFSLEMLDLIQRIYEADESFRSLDFMVHTRSGSRRSSSRSCSAPSFLSLYLV